MQKHHTYLAAAAGMILTALVPILPNLLGPGLGVAVAGLIDWYYAAKS